MDALYKACCDAFDTYMAQIQVRVFKVRDISHDVFSLSWQSGHKKFFILELDESICRQLGLEEWPAMCLLISKAHDEVTEGAVTILEGKVDQQTRPADRLYVCTKISLRLFGVTLPSVSAVQKIDPQTRGMLPAEAAENLTKLVLRGHIIL